jgi:hypothetical protein
MPLFQAQYDKIKRKALLGLNNVNPEASLEFNHAASKPVGFEEPSNKQKTFGLIGGGGTNISTVLGGMEANQV